MCAKKSKLEGIFRGGHSKIVHHSEEIAFFKGQEWEKHKVNSDYKKLDVHSDKMLYE
jgi:ATP-binding cassette subfamily D (ALD) protein 3